MEAKLQQPLIQVRLFDYKTNKLPDASVEIVSKATQKALDVSLNPATGYYEATRFDPRQEYFISVSHPRFASQSRELSQVGNGASETFILGTPDMPVIYRGNVPVPFVDQPKQIGVVVKDGAEAVRKRGLAQIRQVARQLELTAVRTSASTASSGILVFDLNGKEPADIQKRLRALPMVEMAGPVIVGPNGNVSVLSDRLIVKFKAHITEKEAAQIARRFGLEIIRAISYAGNAFEMRLNGAVSYDLLKVAQELVRERLVDYAEPDLYATVEEDLVTPTDWLYPTKWDHPIIRMPEAWQVLRDINANKTFGDPSVLIAVVDSGVDAAHPEFSGTLTNGNPKIAQLYDFGSMVANNTAIGTGDTHGTCCASAATGRANNASAVAGSNEGNTGIAGNCQLMGIRRGGSELRYADMYVWAAGFNPNSSTAGFPAPLARGADVITNSFGISIGMPISGLMKDTFDFLTTYGRQGKGTLLFFSTGNVTNNTDFTLNRPWASYERTFAIGATSLGNDGVTEVVAAYNCYGPAMDFGAPSHDEYVGGSPRHNPPMNYGAITATIRSGTDANTPGKPSVITTLTAPANIGSTTATLASVTGVAVGQAILFRNPGTNQSEGRKISAVNAVTRQITFDAALLNNQPAGTAAFVSSADYKTNFGGTSYATPVCAGIGALVLSANANLSWVEVRELMRRTAVKLDTGNTNPLHRWVDTAGRNSADPAYTGPNFSPLYGYGRVDAAAAVTAARDYEFRRDIHIRDNMADTGLTPSTGTFWRGVDIWVRNNDPAGDAGALPASYATDANTVHQDVLAGQNNWVYARFRNIGDQDSFPFKVRVYVTHFGGAQFAYPDNFMPTTRPSDPLPVPFRPGTYLIGEGSVSSLAAGADGFINVRWPSAMIPPKRVTVDGTEILWHPCLLVEITPRDGFTPPSPFIWDNNNLAQKNLRIIYPDDLTNDTQLAWAGILGNSTKKSRQITVAIRQTGSSLKNRYIRFIDRAATDMLMRLIDSGVISNLKVSQVDGKPAFLIPDDREVIFKMRNLGPVACIIGSTERFKPDREFMLECVQLDESGRVSGGLAVQFEPAGRPK